MNQCANIFAVNHLFQVAMAIHIEDHDGQIIFLTQRGGGKIHHPESPLIYFIEGDGAELGSCGVFLRISGINTVYAGSLEHGIGFDLNTP